MKLTRYEFVYPDGVREGVFNAPFNTDLLRYESRERYWKIYEKLPCPPWVHGVSLLNPTFWFTSKGDKEFGDIGNIIARCLTEEGLLERLEIDVKRKDLPIIYSDAYQLSIPEKAVEGLVVKREILADTIKHRIRLRRRAA